MPPVNPEDEKRANEAADAYKRGEIKNIAELQRRYKAPYHLIRARINGRPPRNTPRPGNKTLDSSQEQAVKLWIKQLDEVGRPPTNEMVTNCVNSILH